jgi:hypothetical protein
MSQAYGAETLLIIPCCAAKAPGGQKVENYLDPLALSVSEKSYSAMLAARASVLKSLKADGRFTSDKYQKNLAIQDGPDVGGMDANGLYAPVLSRYVGTLYSVDGVKTVMQKTLSSKDSPRIMILSALYGPLNPHSGIQDYNLMMSDAPARIWSTAFPPFLEDYVRNNGVEQIVLYVGTATAYFKIAKKSVALVSGKGLIQRAVQYHVENGSTRTTPMQHGLRLLDDLDGADSQAPKRSRGIVENIL